MVKATARLEDTYALTPEAGLRLDIVDPQLRDEVAELLLPLKPRDQETKVVWTLCVRAGPPMQPSDVAEIVAIGRGAGSRTILGWREVANGKVKVIAKETGTSTQVESKTRRIEVTGHSSVYSRPHIRQDTLAVEAQAAVRQAMTALQMRCGAALVHAACVQPAGCDDAVLILGAKGAGKTTMMLSLLAAGGIFIAPDRVFIRPGYAKCEAWAFPDTVRIAQDSLDIAAEINGRRLISEAVIAAAPAYSEKRQFSSLEFLNAYKGKAVERAPIGDYIVLKRTSAPPQMYSVPPKKAAELLRCHALSEGPEALPQPLFPEASRTADWTTFARVAPLRVATGAWSAEALMRLINDR
jgi:hypothetical protein